MAAQVFLQDAAVLQDKYGATCSVYTAVEIFGHPEWKPFKEQVSARGARARLRGAFALRRTLTVARQVLAHVAAACLHATELSSIANAENRDLRAIAASLQSVLGTVNELQVAGRSAASAAAVDKVQDTLEDIKTRIAAAAAVLAGGDPAAALSRGGAGQLEPAVASLLTAAAAAAGAAAANAMPVAAKPFITLEALGTVARLEQEWTVGLGAPALELYDADTARRAAAAKQAGLSGAVRSVAPRARCYALGAVSYHFLACFPRSASAPSCKNGARSCKRLSACRSVTKLTARVLLQLCNSLQTRQARSGSSLTRSAAATTPVLVAQRIRQLALQTRRNDAR